MNEFQDQGIILNVRSHGEGGAVISVLTEHYGRCNGYVNGAQSSKRLRSALQQGNLVQVDWQAKLDGQLGRFDIEAEADYASRVLDDANALCAIQSICALLGMFLPERETHTSLFHGTQAILTMMAAGGDTWPPAYVMWEMAFLKELGYGIDLSQCAVTGTGENLTHVSPKSGRAVCAEQAAPHISKLLPIPQFLQGGGMHENDVYIGLRLTGYFLIHRLLQHSSFQTLPDARIALENAFNLSNITE